MGYYAVWRKNIKPSPNFFMEAGIRQIEWKLLPSSFCFCRQKSESFSGFVGFERKSIQQNAQIFLPNFCFEQSIFSLGLA